MSNTFSIKRFWSYLVHDIRSAVADSGLTLAIIGAMPVFQYFIAQAFSLIFSGHALVMGDWGKIPAYISAFAIALIFFPAKHYGPLTDKKTGSDYLMLPASTLEKWCSMLIVTCLAVPVFLMTELALTDGLLSLVFSGTYGSTAISGIVSVMGKIWSELQTPAGGIAISWPYALFLSWCENVLVFTLGAICFKKSKIGLTFLAYFILMMVITMGAAGIMQALNISNLQIEFETITEEAVIRTLNLIMYAVYTVWFVVFDLLIYLRVKTLKH